MKKTLYTLTIVSLLVSSVFATAFAQSPTKQVLQKEKTEVSEVKNTKNVVSEEDCVFELPEGEKEKYDSQFITVRNRSHVEQGNKFRIKVFVRNTGNMPWFSSKSTCENTNKVFLGTTREKDANSPFFTKQLEGIKDTGWFSANRVKMDQERINPGEIASFTFWAKAPVKDDIFKEYFAPVVDGVTWMENAEFSTMVVVGKYSESPITLRRKMSYVNHSGSLANMDLEGEKLVEVDLSEQKLQLKVGDYVIRTFPVSTGKASTPTPVGTYSIKFKQEVRVGGASPHYIMPKFMWFRAGGYGFHALPSLGNGRGVFWTEALNHIGRPVSHGCVRLLPQDANFMYDFVEPGTKVIVRY